MQRRRRYSGWLVFLIFLSYHLVRAQAPIADSLLTSKTKELTEQHLVQPGDTYYRLAKLYQVPVDSLISWNGEILPAGKFIRVRPKVASDLTPSSESGSSAPVSPTNALFKSTKSKSTVVAVPPNTPVSTTITPAPVIHKTVQRVMVVPFDPYLYFSDADEDIARQSRVPRPQVRYGFRSRLSALLTPPGFETINLLRTGTNRNADSLPEIYKSLNYQYRNVTSSRFNPLPPKQKAIMSGPKTWFLKQKEKAGIATVQEATVAAEGDKYYGVTVKSPNFYTYYNNRYQPDYYLFINQFEIHTDYSNCLDRTTQDFIREFTVHYTIFDAQGNLIAGNKVKIPYVSNMNDLEKISRDNLGKIAQRILADLPPPQIPESEAAQN
ncbi:LysM peptidoglycan-binding domain-containing protein [Adhaeribacter pallidiroseus]|uniref:LysM domain-containing protein n=1 Tax=Adhaeribacter pallidiroseus TaxID=2072847 RepID=A0A369Q964_9BACT|nr:LysM domain-containing protein [Adhaeribacter pallidiroseus]RDC61433.1 hypothetical protein AHMF7616_00012 [Adhaeribacter pallidiroseus]